MYLHEKENWWQFSYDAQTIVEPLAAVRAKQGKLVGQMLSIGFESQNKTLLDTLSIEIMKSSEIEGETTDLQQIRSSLANRLGLEIENSTLPSRYVDGVVEMTLDATQNYMQPLSHERLFGWHNVLFPIGRSGLYTIETGKYRTSEMQVVSGAMGHEKIHYVAPSPDRVPCEMERFIKWINTDNNTDAVLKSAIAHFWFVNIHPFDDGNGRIARAVADMLLARADGSSMRFYSMSNEIVHNRKQYYDILEKAQQSNGDITQWLLWFIQSLNDALDTTQKTFLSVLKKTEFWKKQDNDDLNVRQRKMINRLFDGFEGKLTSGKWGKICKCSPDTALNDIKNLMQRGILRKAEKGGRSTNYELNF